MLYFARINKETQGPFTLRQLVEAGVRPRTYVWCKSMSDWQRAEDVADVCRAMRCVLAGLPIPGELPTVADNVTDRQNGLSGLSPLSEQPGAGAMQDGGGAANGGFRGFYGFGEPERIPDYNLKPQGISIFMAVMLAILCFPLTGMFAVWFAYKFERLWRQSERDGISEDEQRRLRAEAYDKARMYRMMIGITFFVGVMLVGFTIITKM